MPERVVSGLGANVVMPFNRTRCSTEHLVLSFDRAAENAIGIRNCLYARSTAITNA